DLPEGGARLAELLRMLLIHEEPPADAYLLPDEPCQRGAIPTRTDRLHPRGDLGDHRGATVVVGVGCGPRIVIRVTGGVAVCRFGALVPDIEDIASGADGNTLVLAPRARIRGRPVAAIHAPDTLRVRQVDQRAQIDIVVLPAVAVVHAVLEAI